MSDLLIPVGVRIRADYIGLSYNRSKHQRLYRYCFRRATNLSNGEVKDCRLVPGVEYRCTNRVIRVAQQSTAAMGASVNRYAR